MSRGTAEPVPFGTEIDDDSSEMLPVEVPEELPEALQIKLAEMSPFLPLSLLPSPLLPRWSFLLMMRIQLSRDAETQEKQAPF